MTRGREMRMARGMSWSSSGGSTGSSSSSDPADVGRTLERLEAVLRDAMTWLDDVEASVGNGAQTGLAGKELKKLKDWAYDAEDVIDEWKFERLRREVEAGPVADLFMDPSFGRRVEEVMQRRVEIGKQFNFALHLGEAQGPRRHRHGANMVEPRPTSFFPGEQEFYGREDDQAMLVEFLLKGAMEECLNVVPIVGAAGVGKTTLVQHIYNDAKVRQHFGLWGWVSSSEGLQITELVRAIGESLTKRRCRHDNLDDLLHHLWRTTSGLRFLLVLDDIWYETIGRDHWEQLCASFSGCASGSVVILATQDERVADRTGTLPNYILESLSGDPCWSVFQKNAFGSLPTDARLVAIGKKIAKECQGSPLVAKALGLRLRRERNVERWEDFLQRDMWYEVVPGLKLSYDRLPAHLKRCFVYCSMFPKGYLFNREELVQLWIAQGFIEEKRGRLLEDIGFKYFDDLSIMSFFQKSELDAGAFVMPNLLHALAQSVSDGECITIENSNLRNLPRNDLQKARHLSLTPSNSELPTEFLSFAMHLRSFLVVPRWPLKKIAHISLTDKAFRSLNRLRALDVRHTDITALPGTIGNLKHLRYLNLSGTKIENVHPSVFQLYNLQTLDLSCTELRELPGAIGSLGNLLHLRLNVTKITRIPESIGKLSKLQTLHLGVTKIEELPETVGWLKRLRFLCLNVSNVQRLPGSMRELSSLQTLELQGTVDEESNNNAVSTDIDMEEQLNEQTDQIKVNKDVSVMADSCIHSLYFDVQDSSSNDAIREENVCEILQAHTNLEKFDRRFYQGGMFLMWMGNPSFSKLTHVVIKNCIKCKTLPQLGQLPLLKELGIDGMPVQHVGKEFCSGGVREGFPLLEKMSFENMSKWEEWDGVGKGDFPSLNELIFFNCPKLKKVPCFYSSLKVLKLEGCAVSTVQVPESLQELQLCACDNLLELFSECPVLNSLCNVTLMYCQNLTSLPSIRMLEKLWIEECEQLFPCDVSIPEEEKIRILREQLLKCNIIFPAQLNICIPSSTTLFGS